jgi:peroxiredoxin
MLANSVTAKALMRYNRVRESVVHFEAVDLNDAPLGDPMEVNDKAPDFTTTDENGKEVALKDFRGKTVVLFFYPKADTPG